MFVETKFFHKAGEGSGGGGGGSDPHNLGYYADLTALQTAHPTGTDGDFAILGSTDTIWVWDSGTSAWKDTDTKGQVTSVNGQTGAVTVDTLPSQTGQSGKFLTTDGTDASWAAISALQNLATGTGSIAILGPDNAKDYSINMGLYSGAKQNGCTAIGIAANAGGTQSDRASASAYGFYSSATGAASIAIGYNAVASERNSAQIGTGTNSTASTLQFRSYPLVSADGTIPTARLPNAINKYSTMPTAASTNEGWIVQFTGATDSTYTHGYIYECKAQGTTPETYAWEAVEVQASSGGLPSQTGNAGKFLTTDGTDASWTTINGVPDPAGYAWKFLTNDGTNVSWSSYNVLLNVATQSGSIAAGGNSSAVYEAAVAIGSFSSVSGRDSVAIGSGAKSNTSGVGVGTSSSAYYNSVAIGYFAKTTAESAIQIGYGTNSTQKTLQIGYKVGNTYWTYTLLDSDGTIPAARHATLPAADGTYTLQLVIADGVPTLSWVAV